MRCPTCQFENPEDMQFCGRCGSKLATICPKCEFANPPDVQFCGKCGTRLAQEEFTGVHVSQLADMQDRLYIPEPLRQRMDVAEREMEGENRFVTALFADIAGFTPMSQELAPEAVVEKVNACFKVVTDVVYRYEGSINKFIGDCVLALFGAPLVHENDPERAILAALEMRETVGELDLDISIGINTGMMYFGPIGTQRHQEISAYGHDVNLAQRLQDVASPGQILVGVGTYRSTRRMFGYRELEALTLRGIEGSVSAYEVLGVREHPEKVRGIEGLRARMVGRERAFGDLREVAEEWLGGQGQMVSIIGEAGIGKSRLVSELKTYLGSRIDSVAGDNKPAWLEGRCVSIGQPISYWPFLDILRQHFGLSEQDKEPEIAQKVTEGVNDLFPERGEEFLPYLGHLLSIRFGNELDERLRLSTPEQIRHHTLMRLRDLFEALARKDPLLLVLEDLHWSDDLSLDLLSLLMDSLATTPLMLICVYRPDREHRVSRMSTLARRKCLDRYTEITLRELSPRESRQLVGELLTIDDLPEGVKGMILERSEGNPFFIEEVIRSLIDRDLVYREGERWKAREEISEMDVPPTIQSVVLARVDRLEAEAKHVLQCASVIGRLFRYRLLEHLSRYEEDLVGYMDELEDRELVYEERTVPELEYAFKHALTQEATYGSILERRKREFHRQVGEGIERLYRERVEEYYEELAYHYSKSDDKEKAIEYLLKAGKRASRLFANEEAIAHLNRGLELLSALPDTPEHARQELEFQVALGPPLVSTKTYAAPEMGRAFARARELCLRLGDTRQLFPTAVFLGGFHNLRGEFQTTRELSEHLLRIAEKTEDPVLMAIAHKTLVPVLFFLGEFISSRDHIERGMALYDHHQRDSLLFIYGEDFEVSALTFMSWVLWFLGYPDQALRRAQEAIGLAEELSYPRVLAYALGFAGARLFLFRGEVQTAKNHAEAAFRIWAEAGASRILAYTLEGWLCIDTGQVEQGIAQTHQALSALDAEGVQLFKPSLFAKLAEGYGKAGKSVEGLNTLSEALALMQRTDERCWEAELHRLKGELLQTQGEAGDAVEVCFNQALEIARKQQAKSWELRAAMSMARLWGKQGKREEAHKLLADVYNWFTEGFDTADLKDAKALLGELSDD